MVHNERRLMLICSVPFLISCLLLACYGSYAEYLKNRPLHPRPGTEQTYCGVVSDCGMGVVDWDAHPQVSRPYISIRLKDGEERSFWCTCEAGQSGAGMEDYVQIKGAVEERTDLLIATEVTVLEKLST